jgi:hypothetical protein
MLLLQPPPIFSIQRKSTAFTNAACQDALSNWYLTIKRW